MQHGSHGWLSLFFGALFICSVQYSSANSSPTTLNAHEKSFKTSSTLFERPIIRLIHGIEQESHSVNTSWN